MHEETAARIEIDEQPLGQQEEKVAYRDAHVTILESQMDEKLRADLDDLVEELTGATDLARQQFEEELHYIRADFNKAMQNAVAAFLTRQADRIKVED